MFTFKMHKKFTEATKRARMLEDWVVESMKKLLEDFLKKG